MYQPDPLNMIAGAEMILLTDLPHFAHVATASSFMLCLSSNVYEQSWQRYS
jgi:hypothetical protein